MTKKTQKMPGSNGFKYQEQYGVIIICANDSEQETLYNRFKKEGFKTKVVTV